jgi:hypothetical protein
MFPPGVIKFTSPNPAQPLSFYLPKKSKLSAVAFLKEDLKKTEALC